MNPQVDPILAIALIVNLIKPLLAGRLPSAMADSAVRVWRSRWASAERWATRR